jgi:spore coat polysaccharide biosynthesis protein SpsF (cytidylyltransferase family)
MGSSRLPWKVLMDLHGKPVLWHVISRVSRAAYLDKTIVATTIKTEDDAIADFCNRETIPVFRGSENDVLDRYYQCAKSYNISDIVRVTADCPMHDPHVIDYVVEEYLKGGYDYVTNTLEYTYPDGLDVEVFSFHSLEKAWKNAKLGSEREHVTPYIRNSPSMKKKNVYAPKKYPFYRFTLDYNEDFRFISSIFTGLKTDSFGLEEILKYLDDHPDLLTINQHIASNEGYFKSRIDDVKNAIIYGKEIYLKKVEENDINQTLLKNINNEKLKFFIGFTGMGIDKLKLHFKKMYDDLECIVMGIYTTKENKIIGLISLYKLDFHTNSGYIEFFLFGESRYSKKFDDESETIFIEFLINKLNINIKK